jgi:predicted 3-demethylubiquinone-9 3-methyltransferase (glyoxalase superfamily)
MPDMKPCLWFRTEAEEAANFYLSVFPNSSIAGEMHGAPGARPSSTSCSTASPSSR